MSSRGPLGFSRHHCTREANVDAASRVAKSSVDKRMIATLMPVVEKRVSIRRLRVIMLSPPGRLAAGRGETRRARDVALLLLDVGWEFGRRQRAMVQSRGFVGRRGAPKSALP